MKRKMKKLSPPELAYLEGRYEPMLCCGSFDLVYEDQIPNTGVVLLEGEAVLTRKKRVVESVEPGTAMGLQELLRNEPVRHGFKVHVNARVILLQKSDLIDLTDEDCPICKTILSS
jgi:hypothetical protein